MPDDFKTTTGPLSAEDNVSGAQVLGHEENYDLNVALNDAPKVETELDLCPAPLADLSLNAPAELSPGPKADLNSLQNTDPSPLSKVDSNAPLLKSVIPLTPPGDPKVLAEESLSNQTRPLAVIDLSEAATQGESRNPVYRGLYLIGPLPEPRGLDHQARLSLDVLDDPYPPELEEAIAERARILEALAKAKKGRAANQDELVTESLKSISSLERRLAMRWERLRAENLKMARGQNVRWSEYLSSLNGRHQFLARSVLYLRGLLERDVRLAPKNALRILAKNALDLRESLPDLPELAQIDPASLKNSSATVKVAETILARVEAERLRVLDLILSVEKSLSLARANDLSLPAAPESVVVPSLKSGSFAFDQAPLPARPIKVLTLVTLGLLVLAIAYFLALKGGFGPQADPLQPGRLLLVNGLAASVNVLLADDETILLGPGKAILTHLADPVVKAQAFLSDGPFIEEVTLRPATLSDLSTTLVYNVAGAAPLVSLEGPLSQPDSLASQPRLPLGDPKTYYTRANYFLSLPKVVTEPIALYPPSSQAKVMSGLGSVSGQDPDSVLRALKSRESSYGANDVAVKTVVFAQSSYNPVWDEWTFMWLLRLVQLYSKDSRPVLKARWDIYPNDIYARKFLFDLSDASEKAKLCQDALARVAMEKDRVDDQYLVTFCLPEKEWLTHVEKQMATFLNSPTLTSALGRVEFNFGRYPAAYRLWGEALRLDPRTLIFEMDNYGRLARYLGRSGFEIYDEINRWTPEIGQKAIWEVGMDPLDPARDLGPLKAYCFLAKGQLTAALNLATFGFRDEILPFIAASEGADPAYLAEVLAGPQDKGLTPDNAWTKLALLIKNGQDSQIVEAYILAEALDPEFTKSVINQLKNRDAPYKPEIKANLNARFLGQICLAAYLVATDQEALADCRRKAKGFLFSSERPYLKDE
ncbi:MAG: hypothetical protein LBI10_02665 [Deltaproteobacteria bacterium]|jgi:hypothetical protein|nr:hypothetical protein [Deltaproteobacteria bacterium]